MSDLLRGPLGIIVLVGFWVLLQGVVLPRLGVRT